MGSRTLIVEDDGVTRHALRRAVMVLDHETEVATSVAEARAKLSAWRPNQVLLDLMLPDGNGLRVLEEVRKSNLPVKVAVVTGADDDRLLDEVRQSHPDAFFSKPLNVADLMKWLRETGDEA